jgi:Flp pilus assembly protein TadD
MAYAQLGNLTAALREFDLAKGLTEDGRDLQAVRAYAYARNGDGPSARAILRKLEPVADRKPIAYGIATIYSALGEKDVAFFWLERAFRERSAWRCYIKVDPRLDGLRNDGRFKTYLKQAGLGE